MSERLYGRLRAWRKADPHRSLRAFLLMTALAAAVLLVITDWRKASVPLTEGLERNPYGGGSRTERLIAETENKEKTEIDVEVKEQLYTTEETKALFDKCIRQLDTALDLISSYLAGRAALKASAIPEISPV